MVGGLVDPDSALLSSGDFLNILLLRSWSFKLPSCGKPFPNSSSYDLA